MNWSMARLYHYSMMMNNGHSTLHGTLFYDDELEWCRVTGWEVECGTTLVYYSPIHLNDQTLAEHHASLREVLTWIKGSPSVPVTTRYKSSRLLRKSLRAGEKCLWTRVLASSVPIDIEMGSVCLQSVPRIQVTQHLLTEHRNLFSSMARLYREMTTKQKSPQKQFGGDRVAY